MYVCVPVCLLLVVRLDWACLRTCLLDHLQKKICNQNGQTKIALLSSWDFFVLCACICTAERLCVPSCDSHVLVCIRVRPMIDEMVYGR